MGVTDVSSAKDLNSLVSGNITPVTNLGLMRDHLSQWKTYHLTQKLIKALRKDDVQLASEAIGKGADVNSMFWGDHVGPRFNTNKMIAPYERVEYTPHLYAVMHKKQELADLLIRFGADTTKKGNKCLFEREIIQYPIEITGAIFCKDSYRNRMALVYDEKSGQVLFIPSKYGEYIEVLVSPGDVLIRKYIFINSQNISVANNNEYLEDLLRASRGKSKQDFTDIGNTDSKKTHYFLSHQDIEKENLLSSQYEAFLSNWKDQVAMPLE